MDELGAVHGGESFENNYTPQSNLLPSSNSIPSIFTLPVDHFEINPHPGHSSPIILNFASQNSWEENLHPVNLQKLIIDSSTDINRSRKVKKKGNSILLPTFSPSFFLQLTARASKPAKSSKRIRTRSPSQVYEHIMAERRRRDQLSRLFIALSAVIPGLKKTDKNSILIDAIKHLTHLQQRATTLKELVMESTVIVKKSKLIVEDEGSSNEKIGSSDDLSSEIEARIINSNILIRVHCGKQKGILANLLSKVESLDMVVVNTNVTPFGSCALDITIIAEMEKDFNISVREVVLSLRRVLQAADV